MQIKRKVFVRLVVALSLAGLLGYGAWRVLKRPHPVDLGDLANYTDPSRDALLTADPAGETPARVVYLDQGWEPRDSMEFYTRPQGSRLLPYSWFLALEQPTGEALFRDPANRNVFDARRSRFHRLSSLNVSSSGDTSTRREPS